MTLRLEYMERYMTIIRKAIPGDIDAVEKIYDAMHDGEEAGKTNTGWKRGIYPIRETAEAALGRQDLFVACNEEGAVTAAAVINQTQVPEYADCDWQYPAKDDEVMVLHTLVVNPAYQSQGIGKSFVAFYEEYAKDNGCPYLRMDTNELNLPARRMYAGLGYKEIGIIPCVFNGIEGVQLVCMEKKL